MDTLERLITLGLGVLLGTLASWQRAVFKSRQEDAHLLKLAYHEVCDFEAAQIALEAVGPEAASKLSNESTGAFLKSELCLLLPAEIRSELKAVHTWINGFNEALIVGHEKLLEFSSHSDVRSLEFSKLLILNSLLYTTEFRYRLLGKKSGHIELLKKMSPLEIHTLEVKMGLD